MEENHLFRNGTGMQMKETNMNCRCRECPRRAPIIAHKSQPMKKSLSFF
jgi:hypothetical protein